jgi:HEAT repeat protein
LVRALSDPDAIVRGLAAVALRETAPVSAIPALIAGLKDSDSSVRMVCAEALGRMKAADAVPALIAVSQKPDEHLHVLRNVVAALGEIGPAAAPAIPALEALKSNPRLRYPASAAQEKIAKRP